MFFGGIRVTLFKFNFKCLFSLNFLFQSSPKKKKYSLKFRFSARILLHALPHDNARQKACIMYKSLHKIFGFCRIVSLNNCCLWSDSTEKKMRNINFVVSGSRSIKNFIRFVEFKFVKVSHSVWQERNSTCLLF